MKKELTEEQKEAIDGFTDELARILVMTAKDIRNKEEEKLNNQLS